MSTPPVCKDKLLNGVCTKGKDCEFCNRKVEPEKKADAGVINVKDLNLKAKEFIPKSKKNDKLKFNPNAKEYIPMAARPKEEDKKDEEKENEDDNEINEDDLKNQEEMDMIENNLIEDELMDQLDDDSEDEDKWFPKYQNCECCKGFVYKCNGEACKSLGQCFCKMKDDCDENIEEAAADDDEA